MRVAAPPVLLALVVALAACDGRGPAPAPPPPPVPTRTHPPVPPSRGPSLVVLPAGAPSSGRGLPEARVEVVADAEGRQRGLMGRPRLGPDEGMLFAYPDDDDRSFWMKDCPFPLDAAFIDAGGRILNVEEMTPGAGLPESELRRWESAGPARYVLEMEGGWFRSRAIGAGDRVDLEAALRGVVPR